MSQEGQEVKYVCYCLLALFVFVIGILVYFRMMPAVNEVRIESGVSVFAETGSRHEILATGYSKEGSARFRIRDISGESKIIEAKLMLDRKRYASGGASPSYYTVVVPSLEKLFNMQGDRDFTFMVEWESSEIIEVILKIYKK